MTTAPLPTGHRSRPVRISPEIRLAGATTVAITVAAVLLAVLSGSSAVLGALVGCGMVLVFFGLGSLTMDVVATVSPPASLLVALLTYTLQVVAVGVVFLALDASGALGSTVHAGWLAGSVIAATVGWLAAQTVAATRSRQPIYDLPASGPLPVGDRPEASAS